MSKVTNSRELCELVLSSIDATPAEKRLAQVRLDELDAGDASRLYIRLDAADAAPPDRGAIVAAIKKLDPEFVDHASHTINFLQGKLDQMKASHVTATMTTTSNPHQPIARTDAFETALITARNSAATAWCSNDAERQATVARLDSATAHRIELDEYRASRAVESRLDAKTEQPLSIVTRAQVEYAKRMRALGSDDGNGPKSAA